MRDLRKTMPCQAVAADAGIEPPPDITVKYRRGAQTVVLKPSEVLLRSESASDKLQTMQLPQLEKPSPTVATHVFRSTRQAAAVTNPRACHSAATIKAASLVRPAPVDAQRQTLVTQGSLARTVLTGAISGGVAAPAQQSPATFIGRFLQEAQPEPAEHVIAQPPMPTLAEQCGQLQAAPFFHGLPAGQILHALENAELQIIAPGRDLFLNLEHSALLVLAGQVALGYFDAEKLATESAAQEAATKVHEWAESAVKRERLRRARVGPLSRLATANLATFGEGEVVMLQTQPRAREFALYTITPIIGVRLTRALLDRWAGTYQFFMARLRRALQVTQHRIAHREESQALVADFFVRHGMSVSLSLRVREIDRCIECLECETACAQRYGVKRLSLHGRLLGSVDFVDCCHTCIDQRCIDPCAFNAIAFDDVKKEVLIDEAACTGCTLCASACPYNAIEMHELDEQPLLKLRLQKENKLGSARDAAHPLRRIASKCDHCVSYPEQACISACPTGALLEIDPKAAFIERTEGMVQAIAQGFPQTLVGDQKLFRSEALIESFATPSSLSRAGRLWLPTRMLWQLGIPAFILCLIELALRQLAPQVSAQFAYLTSIENLEPEVALINVSYMPGSRFALVLGWIGTLLTASSVVGLLLNRMIRQRTTDARQNWFGYHIWAGTFGFLCIVLHTAAKLDTWVSIPFWFMVAATASGIVGRYLFTRAKAQEAQLALRSALPRQHALWIWLSSSLQGWRWLHIVASIIFAALALTHIFLALR